jgi:hypothetical protein
MPIALSQVKRGVRVPLLRRVQQWAGRKARPYRDQPIVTLKRAA